MGNEEHGERSLAVPLNAFYGQEGDWLIVGVFLAAGGAGILAIWLNLGWLVLALVEAPFLLLLSLLTIRVGGYRLADYLVLWLSILLWLRSSTPYAGRILPPEGGELRFL